MALSLLFLLGLTHCFGGALSILVVPCLDGNLLVNTTQPTYGNMGGSHIICLVTNVPVYIAKLTNPNSGLIDY